MVEPLLQPLVTPETTPVHPVRTPSHIGRLTRLLPAGL